MRRYSIIQQCPQLKNVMCHWPPCLFDHQTQSLNGLLPWEDMMTGGQHGREVRFVFLERKLEPKRISEVDIWLMDYQTPLWRQRIMCIKKHIIVSTFISQGSNNSISSMFRARSLYCGLYGSHLTFIDLSFLSGASRTSLKLLAKSVFWVCILSRWIRLGEVLVNSNTHNRVSDILVISFGQWQMKLREPIVLSNLMYLLM